MNLEENTVLEIEQALPPEVPPEFPFNPPAVQPNVSVPMVYVERRERVEYCVKSFKAIEAKQLETELNALGRDGWWLIQVIQQDKNVLLVFSRTGKD